MEGRDVTNWCMGCGRDIPDNDYCVMCQNVLGVDAKGESLSTDADTNLRETDTMGIRNPQEECPDDTVCAHCETKLPENPKDGTWGYNGFCGPSCCLHYLLTVAGVNKGISGMDAIMGRKAIRELENGHDHSGSQR